MQVLIYPLNGYQNIIPDVLVQTQYPAPFKVLSILKNLITLIAGGQHAGVQGPRRAGGEFVYPGLTQHHPKALQTLGMWLALVRVAHHDATVLGIAVLMLMLNPPNFIAYLCLLQRVVRWCQDILGHMSRIHVRRRMCSIAVCLIMFAPGLDFRCCS